MLRRKKEALLNSGAQSDSGPQIVHKSLGSVHSFTDLWCMKSQFDANLQRKWTLHPFILSFFTEKSQLSPTHGGFSGKDFWGRLSTRRCLAVAKALHLATCNPNYAPDHIIFGSSESKTNCHPKTKTQIVALLALHASSHCLEESYQKPDQNFMIEPFYPAPTSNII